MTERSEKNGLGAILAIIGAVVTIGATLIIFLTQYEYLVAFQIDRGHECSHTIGYFLPIYADIGVLGGTFWAIGAVGFFQKKQWAFPLAVIGNVLSLFSSFWPNIPAMESGAIPPYWFGIFLVNLVLYFVMAKVNGKISMKRILLGLMMGMGFILCFINGIASTTRLLTRGDDYYIISQRLSMIASICWGFATVGVLLAPKEWVRLTSIGAGILGSISGFILGIYSILSPINEEGFSMFLLSPVISLVLLILLMWPGIWNALVKTNEK